MHQVTLNLICTVSGPRKDICFTVCEPQSLTHYPMKKQCIFCISYTRITKHKRLHDFRRQLIHAALEIIHH
jgi:hypothetical protein